MTKKELEDLHADLHATIVKELLKRVQSGEATAAEFTAGLKLLKDNGVTIATHGGKLPKDVMALRDALAKFEPGSDEIPEFVQ